MQWFNVGDILALRSCCKDLASIFSEQMIEKLVELGNLNAELRINFWILQAPFFELENSLKRELNV